MQIRPSLRALACLVLLVSASGGAVLEVGPGKTYASIGAVSWESLQPGDTVLIHWRAAPYAEKWVIGRQGEPASPIIVRGVPGPAGQLPVISGVGATTRAALNYWNEVRGLIKIGGSNTPPNTTPKHIVIENLELRSARPPYTFTAANGSTQSYSNNAAAIYLEKGENITIRNCTITDSGNGIFIGSPSSQPSRDFLIEGNYIHSNGNVGRAFEHNNYSAAIGVVFQYNRFGPLRSGADGNNLKDRSAGLVVRYNWIEGGNRQLDLVDAEDSSLIVGDPSYRTTHVYGNVLIEPAGDGNRQMIHYGGDSGTTSDYRKGTLHVYNNTFVSTRTDRTTLMRLSTNEETADFRNNIVYPTLAGNTVSLLDQSGVLYLTHNWFKPGWVDTFGTLSGTIHDDGTAVVGASPGFEDAAVQDFRLTAGAAAIDAAGPPAPEVAGAPPVEHYVKHQSSEARLNVSGYDIGAYEYFAPGGSFCDLNGDSEVTVVDVQNLVNIIIGVSAGAPGEGDLNQDGSVDGLDLDILLEDILGVAACPA